MGSTMAEQWFRCLTPPTATPRLRLLLFPHAGGAAGYFRAWGQAVPAGVEVLAVRYPGREDRFREPLIGSVAGLADPIAEACASLTDAPLAFFGHSMGAMVAYETARRLAGHSTLRAVFLSSRPAPGHETKRGLANATDAELVADLTELGGTDAEFLKYPELLELILPVLRNDYSVVDGYRPEPGAAPLELPVTGYLGDSERYVDEAGVAAWAERTNGPFALRSFTGGHFYLADHTQELLGDMLGRLGIR
ncbi:thioesterase [Kitasatospora acidiphila]|uniref:Thioesterase n=1 Tax=Kitasatospora acidiphila TaxID=2567942 RepID=A0A540W0M6_9ACTN|nr:alpha/beta fold hydrolase [Kitasatospora acidiphila]TQF02543.1 thioesterase [Kitasatospora acidiphila]